MTVDELVDIECHAVIARLDICAPTVVVDADTRVICRLKQGSQRVREAAETAISIEQRLKIQIGGGSDAAQGGRRTGRCLGGARRRAIADNCSGDMRAVPIRVRCIAGTAQGHRHYLLGREIGVPLIYAGICHANGLAPSVKGQQTRRWACLFDANQSARHVATQLWRPRSCDAGYAGKRRHVFDVGRVEHEAYGASRFRYDTSTEAADRLGYGIEVSRLVANCFETARTKDGVGPGKADRCFDRERSQGARAVENDRILERRGSAEDLPRKRFDRSVWSKVLHEGKGP